MQARYYDPVIGRFYSNDPVGYTGANPVMSFNRYMYANNNPYKYVDPDGRFIFTAIAVAAVAYAAYDGYQDGGATGALAEASGYNDAVSSYNSIKSGDYSGAAISAAGILCKACKGATRVRHYTSKSGMGGIQDSGVIKASDQNSVFTVKAKGKPGSARDVEKQLGIKKGKGNAYVEFDASPDEFTTIKNAKTGATERIFKGDVNLEGRNATFKKNR